MDLALAPIGPIEAAMIPRSRRSWWQVEYTDGKILNEWKTLQWVKMYLPFGSNLTSRWEDIPKVGIKSLTLLCPNGHAGVLECNGEAVFQFKIGGVGVGSGQYCNAHIIGRVDDLNGKCVCYAWEYDKKKLVRFEDNVTRLAYRNIGALSLGPHTGVK